MAPKISTPGPAGAAGAAGPVGPAGRGPAGPGLGDGEVTTARLADNAVTSAKVAPESLTSADLAANAVSSQEIDVSAVTDAEIAPGAVRSSEVLDGSLVADDFAKASGAGFIIDYFELDPNECLSASFNAGVPTGGEVVLVSPGSNWPSGLTYTARPNATNNIAIDVCNASAATIDPPSTPWTYVVLETNF